MAVDLRVPEHIWGGWLDAAELNPERRIKAHQDGQWGRKHQAATPEDCRDCQRQVAVCKSKRRHETPSDVLAHCAEEGANGRLLVPYRCHWTDGLHWHAHTAKGSARRKRARKIARRHAPPTTVQAPQTSEQEAAE